MQKVLLTGANGYIGVHIIKVLLERGYDVVGTVRSPTKTPYLLKLFKWHPRLNFAIVDDITAPRAFDQVIKVNRFDAVLHTSSPFTIKAKDIEKELYEPAIRGTTGILESLKAHGGPQLKRVVVLSSFVAVVDVKKGPNPGYVYTEKDWNPITWEEGLLAPNLGYRASKTFAERAAWEFMQQENPTFELTTLCPPMVYGPPIHEITDLETLNASAEEMYGYFTGTREPRNGVWVWVDVRDIAVAHALALESPVAASQRYIISTGNYSAQYLLGLVWKHYQDRAQSLNIPQPSEDLYPEGGVYSVDNSKSKQELGLEYSYTLEQSFLQTLTRFSELEKNILGQTKA